MCTLQAVTIDTINGKYAIYRYKPEPEESLHLLHMVTGSVACMNVAACTPIIELMTIEPVILLFAVRSSSIVCVHKEMIIKMKNKK